MTNGNVTTSKEVKVLVRPNRSEPTSDHSGYVFAQDLTITPEQAQQIADENELMTQMQASGMNNYLAATPTINTNGAFNSIQAGEMGAYPISFSVGDAQITKYVYVKPQNAVTTNPAKESNWLVAYDGGVVTQSQIAAMSDEDLFKRFNSFAVYENQQFDSDDYQPVAGVQDQFGLILPMPMEELKKQIGVFDLTVMYDRDGDSFTPWDRMEYPVKIIIAPDGAVVSADEDGYIYAQDTVIEKIDAPASMQELITIMNSSGVVDYTNLTNDQINVTSPNESDILSGKDGLYPVTFSPKNDPSISITVNLTILPQRPNGATDVGNGWVYANNLMITQDQAKAIASQESLAETTYMDASAMQDNVSVPQSNIIVNVDSNDWSNIKAGNVDVYDIKFTLPNQTQSHVAKLTVRPNDSQPTQNNLGYVDGRDKVIKQSEARAQISGRNSLVTVMEGSAVYNSQESTNISADSSNWDEIGRYEIGEYQVDLTLNEDNNPTISKTLWIVSDKAVISPDRYSFIDASNYVIHARDAKQLANENALINLMKVSTNIEGDITVSVDNWDDVVAGVVNDYQVTFTSGSGSDQLSITVTLSVVDDETIITGDHLGYITAKNKVVKSSDAPTVFAGRNFPETVANQLSLEGYYDGQKIDVNTTNFNINAGSRLQQNYIKTGQYDFDAGYSAYPIKINMAQDTNAQVVKNVIIVGDDAVISADEQTFVDANNTVITSTQAQALANKQALETTMGAVSVSSPINVSVSDADWNSITAGTINDKVGYDVNFSVGTTGNDDFASKDTKLFVVDEDAVISDDQKGYIDTNTVILKSSEAKQMFANNLEDSIKSVMGTNAIYNGNDVLAEVVVDTNNQDANIQNGVYDETTGYSMYPISYTYEYEILYLGETFNIVNNKKQIIIVDDNADVSVDQNVMVNGNNGRIHKNQATGITNAEDLKQYINPVAIIGDNVVDINDININVDPTVLATIQSGKLGSYPVTLWVDGDGNAATTDDYASKEVIITVYDDSTEFGTTAAISGKNFQIDIDEVQTLTPDDAVNRAEGKGWLLDGTNNNLEVNANISNVQPVVGVYPVELTAGDATTTVYATVVGPNSNVANNELINAEDFTININDVDAADFVTEAQAQAWGTTTGQAINPVTLVTQKPTAVGAYKMTYTTPNGTTTTSITNVIDDQTQVGTTAAVRGENFEITIDEAKNLTPQQAVTNAKGKGWLLDATNNNLDVNADISNVKPQVGVYPVELTAGDATTTVNAIVKGSNSVVNETNKEMINAENFTIHIDNVPGADFVTEGKAEAWDTETRDSVTPVTMVGQKPTAVGAYPITYTTQKGTQTTIIANVIDDSTVINDNNTVAIRGENFQITIADAQTLTQDQATNFAKGKGWKTDGTNNNLPVTSDITNVLPQVGVYPVVLTTTDGVNSATTVMATVVGPNTVVNDAENEIIDANNFTIDLTVNPNPTTDFAIEQAGANAWNTQTGDKITVSVVGDQVPTTPGPHQMTFTTPNGTTTTVVVNVIGVNEEEGPNATISGHDFEIDLSEITDNGITDQEVKDLSDADAWWNDGHTPKPGVTVDKTILDAVTKPGVYPVELIVTEEQDTHKTVNAIVKGPNTVVNKDLNEMINAEDFEIFLDEVPSTDFVQAGQAEAWDTETRDPINPVTMVGQKPTEIGAYEVTYTTPNGTTTTAIVNVKDRNTVQDDEGKVNVRGENFRIPVREVAGLTDERVVELSKAQGWKYDGTDNNLPVTPNKNNILPQVGVYPVELTTTDGVNSATTTVLATVYDANTVINGNTMIDADDHTSIPKDTVDKMTDEEFIEAISGVAWDTTTGQKLPVSLKNPKPTEVGTHDVTLVAPDGTEITVQVTILPMMTPMNIAPDIQFIYPTYDKNTNSITVLVQTPITTLEIAKATDHEDGDITDKMTWTITRVKSRQADEALDTSTAPREYLITYKVYDSKGASCTRSVTVYVVPIILPGDDDNMDTEDDILVTPKPDAVTPPTVNPDGSVVLPEGGEITFPDYPGNDDIITVPPGSTIFPDGTIIAPDGSETKPMPDGSIQLPGIDGSVSKDETDNPVFKPEGDTTVNPDGSLTAPENGGTITFPNNPDNDDITLVPGGSNIAPDGTITTPEGGVVRPRPEGGVELTGDDDIVNGPNNIDNPFVTPEGDGPIVVNPDGSVTLPDDEKGNLTYPNSSFDGTITIPAGSTVDNHGNVTTPDGVTIPTNADGSIFMPGQDDSLLPNDRVDDPAVIPSKDATINNDGSVDLKEEGTLVFPNNPDNTNKVTIPAGSHIDPNGDVTTPDGVTVRPNPDGSFELPGQEGTIDQDPSDNPFVTPGKGDSIINPDGSVTVPNVEGSTVTFPNTPENGNTIVIPGGTNVKPDGLITTPNGGVMMPNADGSIIIPADGSMDTENAIVRPNNGQQVLVDADGNITLPEGGEVEYNNCIVPVAIGGVIGQDAVVRNPGNDGVLFTSDDEILDPRSYCIVKPEAIAPNKGQGTNTGIGVNVIVPFIGLVGALILLIILFIKRRKDKEQ